MKLQKKRGTQKKTVLQKNQAFATAPSPKSPHNEWNKKNKIILFCFILIVTIGIITYLLSQEGVVQHIIGTAVGLIGACDLALIPLLSTNEIKLKLRKRLNLSEAAYTKGVTYCLVSINGTILMVAFIAAFITPWIQSEEIKSTPITGKVLCKSNEQVEGIWVDTVNGGSGWADWYATKSNGSEVEFNYVLPNGGPYNLHVGCGGSKQIWKNTYNTETGSGTIQDHNFHFFTCQDIPLEGGYGSCQRQY